MPGLLSLSRLVPEGFHVGSVGKTGTDIVVHVCADKETSVCPVCARRSRAVHSRYIRHAADRPFSGQPFRLEVVTRRFFGRTMSCPRKIFSERFSSATLAPRAGRAGRLDAIVHALGLALGGRPGSAMAARLLVPAALFYFFAGRTFVRDAYISQSQSRTPSSQQ